MSRFSWFNATSLTLGFAFLYLPMVILIVYSFNEGRNVTIWAGFSTKWYGELVRNEQFLDAAWVTLRVAIFSSTLATVLGTMAADVLVRGGAGGLAPQNARAGRHEPLACAPLVQFGNLCKAFDLLRRGRVELHGQHHKMTGRALASGGAADKLTILFGISRGYPAAAGIRIHWVLRPNGVPKVVSWRRGSVNGSGERTFPNIAREFL